MSRIAIQPPVYAAAAVNVTRPWVELPGGGRRKNVPQTEKAMRLAIATGYAVAAYLQIHPQYRAGEAQNLAAYQLDAALATVFRQQQFAAEAAHWDMARDKVLDARRADDWNDFMRREVQARGTAKRGMPRTMVDRTPDLNMLAMALGAAQKAVVPATRATLLPQTGADFAVHGVA